jgi:hypothetical protein
MCVFVEKRLNDGMAVLGPFASPQCSSAELQKQRALASEPSDTHRPLVVPAYRRCKKLSFLPFLSTLLRLTLIETSVRLSWCRNDESFQLSHQAGLISGYSTVHVDGLTSSVTKATERVSPKDFQLPHRRRCSFASDSIRTVVPRFGQEPAECIESIDGFDCIEGFDDSLSDCNADDASGWTGKTLTTVLVSESDLIARLSTRFHPAMETPAAAVGLSVKTTKSPKRFVVGAGVPYFVPMEMRMYVEDSALPPATVKPSHPHRRAIGDTQSPETVRRGWFFWWGMCGGDCTAAVATVD